MKTAERRPAAKAPAGRKPVAKRPALKKPAAAKPSRSSAIAKASAKALRLAGIGTDAVAKATGRAWDQWLAILDKAGAAAMPHKAIAAMLAERYGLPPWWSQMVAVGYEQARGLRKAHQRSDGFAANASRTVLAPLQRLYGAWADRNLRSLWLGPAPISVKRATDGKSMRIDWTVGGSRVEVSFLPARGGKSRVQVEHGKLADEKAQEAQKSFWKGALDRLKAMLEKAA